MKLLKKYKAEISIFIFFILVRMPGLGYDIFNTDVWKWKTRVFNFSSGLFSLDFAQTAQTYHPGVVLMWIGTVAIKAYSFYYKIILGITPPDNNVFFIFQLHVFQKIFVVLVLGFTLAILYNALKNMFTVRYAVIACVLLIFEPFYAALTRVFHLEGLLTTFMITSFVWLYYFLNERTKTKRLYVSAFFAALAVLTKTSSLFLLPFFGLVLFLHSFEKQKFKDAVLIAMLPYMKWLTTFLGFCLLLWPALWTSSADVLRLLVSGIYDTGVVAGHGQIYFGKFVQDPGITFYPVVFALRSSIVLLFGLIGVIFARRSFDENRKRFIFYLVLFAVLYMVEMTIPTKKLDRYFLPSLVALSLVSSFYFDWVIDKFKNIQIRNIAVLLVGSFVLITNLWVHPDYFSYYNPLFGGLEKGIYVIEPKWLIGQQEVVSYFSTIKRVGEYEDFGEQSLDSLLNTDAIDNKLVIGFPEKYYTQVWPFVKLIGAEATIKDITGQATNTEFFVYPVWDDTSNEEERFEIIKYDEIKLRGVPIYNVYKVME